MINKYNQFIPESIFIQIQICTHCINYYNVIQNGFKTLKNNKRVPMLDCSSF